MIGYAAPPRPQKITFGDMCNSGVHGVVVYCSDYRCAPRAATLTATLLGLTRRPGLGFGLGIPDGLSQHLA